MNSKVFFTGIDQYWSDILSHVNGAVIYMDDPSAECLHWYYGIDKLFKYGAISVEKISPFVKADSSVKKCVFIFMNAIQDDALRTLKIALQANAFKSIVVITSLPAKFHDGNLEDFNFLEENIQKMSGNTHCTVTIQHIPLFSAQLAHNLLILPSFAEHFSIFKCGLLEMNRKRTADSSFKSLPADMQINVKQLAFCFDALLDTFQVKPDVFSLGMLSHIVGFELVNLLQLQKRPHHRKVSMIIVDRLLDLAGPLSQSCESMLDQVLRAFPHLPGHVFDVSIPMNDIAACKNELVFDRPLLAPGSLAHKNTPEELTAYYAILEKNPREALIEVNRLIVECATCESLSIDMGKRLTTDELKKRILAFKSKPNLIKQYCGLLQLALAVVQALEHTSKNPVDHLSATEKALMQYLTTSAEEVLSNLMQMVSEYEEVNFNMEEILTFLGFIYMLSGCSSIENESTMQATLMETFFKDHDFSEVLSLFVDGTLEFDRILSAVRTYFDVLRRLSTVRKGLKRYDSVFKSVNPAFPVSYDPLLKQLLQDVLNPELNNIPDLEFQSGGIKDYIKTGFSLFMNVNKPHPRDNMDIFLVILGGLTPGEIKFIRQIEEQHKSRQIYVCCTQVLTPSDVLKDLGAIVKELAQDVSDEED